MVIYDLVITKSFFKTVRTTRKETKKSFLTFELRKDFPRSIYSGRNSRIRITLNAPFYFNQKAAFLASYLSFQSTVRTHLHSVLDRCTYTSSALTGSKSFSNDVGSNWKTRMSKRTEAKPSRSEWKERN